MIWKQALIRCALPLLALLTTAYAADQGWPSYGGDFGGTRYSALDQINSANVSRLKVVWTYHTGAFQQPGELNRNAAFEATPILFDGALYVSTPFDQVISLNPSTGRENWKFDPHIDRTFSEPTVTSRGVASWSAPNWSALSQPRGECSARIFIGTIDARLLAIDAKTGRPCGDFGQRGGIDLRRDVDFRKGVEYKVTSPPAVVGELVVVGSQIGDNRAVVVPRGIVRAFDVRSGRLKWTWDPLPWAQHQRLRTGGGNAWSAFSIDLQRGLIFIPTGSASPDAYGVLRPGDNRFANSVVALEASTGRLVWQFQVVHHDLWDYDVASQPLLFTFRENIPAVAIATKMGYVFVLDRTTGEPLYPVTERPVPKSDIPGEHASPTQPISTLPPLVPQRFSASEIWAASAEDRKFCEAKIAGLRNEGIYTPPSTKGSIVFPGAVGGVNWGSLALNPQTGVLFANTNRLAYLVRLIPREEADRIWARVGRRLDAWELMLEQMQSGQGRPVVLRNRFKGEISKQLETPYYLEREPLKTPAGLPCTPQPWGTISALSLNTGRMVWETTLGTMIPGRKTGSINVGGPITTAGNLVFTAATIEPYLRAFNAGTGQEIWQGSIPASAQATPMTYSVNGRQFVVICAGGHGLLGARQSDAVVAFALSENPRANSLADRSNVRLGSMVGSIESGLARR